MTKGFDDLLKKVSECSKKTVAVDGYFATLTDEMSEKEVADLKEKFGASLLAVYRTL